jgi:hypothetical protein
MSSVNEESGISSLGPRPPEEELRHHLADALTKAGYNRLCLLKERPPAPVLGPTWAGIFFTVAFAISFSLGAKLELSLSWLWTAIAGVVFFGAIPVLGGRWMKALKFILVSWVGLAVLVTIEHGFAGLLDTYGIAVVLTGVLYLPVRLFRNGLGVDLKALLRSIPLLFPLVLLLLFAPLVTADLWQVADAAETTRLIWLAILILVPLALVLIGRLIGSLPSVVVDTGMALAADPNAARAVDPLVKRLAGPYAGSWVLNNGGAILQSGFDRSLVRDFSPYLAEVVRRPIRRAVVVRTMLMLGGLGICVFAYLYALSVILVPSDVAQEWSHAPTSNSAITIFGLNLSIPADPYLGVSILLSIVALGAFLAFLTVEETYSRAMAGALLHDPVREFMLLALPYTRLRERAILGEAPTDQFGPFAEPDSPAG